MARQSAESENARRLEEQIRAQQAAEAAQKAAEQQVEAIFPSHELFVFVWGPGPKVI